jgi:hypothetical protein
MWKYRGLGVANEIVESQGGRLEVNLAPGVHIGKEADVTKEGNEKKVKVLWGWIGHERSVKEYPNGCPICGHDVMYVTNAKLEGGQPGPARIKVGGKVVVGDKIQGLCPTCVGKRQHHAKKCRACQPRQHH